MLRPGRKSDTMIFDSPMQNSLFLAAPTCWICCRSAGDRSLNSDSTERKAESVERQPRQTVILRQKKPVNKLGQTCVHRACERSGRPGFYFTCHCRLPDPDHPEKPQSRASLRSQCTNILAWRHGGGTPVCMWCRFLIFGTGCTDAG